jgi:peptidoglycan/LPS O-acetylase OafA/YrhL
MQSTGLMSYFKDILQRRVSSGRYVPEIDALRFLALIPVLIHHYTERVYRCLEQNDFITQSQAAFREMIPNGRLGVELFFVISGYVISFPYFASKLGQDGLGGAARSPFTLANYYGRRITRIEPPYLLAMLGIFVAVQMLPSSSFSGVRTFDRAEITSSTSFAASILYLHGVLLGTIPKLNPPAWSLEIEVQFYLIAPIIFWMFAKGIQRHASPLAVCGIGIVSAVLAAVITGTLLGDYQRFFVSRYLPYFLLGICLSLLTITKRILHPTPRWSNAFIVGGMVAMYFIGTVENGFSDSAQPMYVAGKLAALSCLFIGLFGKGSIARFLSLPCFTVLGGMCYSIYLTHLPVMQFVTPKVVRWLDNPNLVTVLLLALIPTIFCVLAIAIAFFLLIEKPCMNPKWVSNVRRRVMLT